MPSKKALPTRELPAISKELLDQLVTGPMSPAEAQEIASTFKKALYERILTRVQALPGVRSAALSGWLPISPTF